jgi:hypothetical protein
MGTIVGLEKETEIEVVAFTLKWGPLPAKALSLYCRGTFYLPLLFDVSL